MIGRDERREKGAGRAAMVNHDQVALFLSTLFGPSRDRAGQAFVTSLLNEYSPEKEKKLLTRSLDMVVGHAERWDIPGRGFFVCPNLLKETSRRRAKEEVGLIVTIHADVDLKDIVIDRDALLDTARNLKFSPTMIVSSGNGYHLYWVLAEPLEATEANIELAETLNGLVSDLLGGDLRARDVSRLLRLPGTHNTKNGEWKDVEVVEVLLDCFYDPADLEEWLTVASPLVQRIERGEAGIPAAASSNPYIEIAKRLGFKPPIDVEQRLANMSYQGSGDTSIHQTQLQVTASLLSRGEPLEDVIELVLGATRSAAGQFGDRWNWRREETAIRRMGEEWLRKNPEVRKVAPAVKATAAATGEKEEQQAEPMKAAGAAGAAGAKIVRLATSTERPHKKRKEKLAIHSIVGEAVIGALKERDEHLIITAGQIWRYADGLWSCPALEGRRWLEVEIEIAARALGITSDNRLISETRQWLLRNPDLFRDDVEWDAQGKIPTRSGLLDPQTLTIEPPRADHYATWRIECDYDPAATCPWWKTMLADTFGDRHEPLRRATIGTLQEVLGLSLVENKPKALTKALVLQGGSDSGKTSILDVMSGLLSPNPISMAMDAVGGTHGLMEFMRRAPWVLHEAFDQSKWHFSSIVKSILTGDPVQINVKNGAIVTKRIKAPVFWGTNHPPQFREATKAIVNRMIVMKCRQTFDENTPVGVAIEAARHGYAEPSRFILDVEMPGLLNWAIEGLRRARERGHLQLTDEIIETRAEIRSDSNLVDGFIRECVELRSNGMVATPDFCAAFTVWWHENKGENRGGPSNDAIGKALSSLGDGRIASHRDNEKRYYLGLHLNGAGMDYWRGASSSTLAQGKTSRISVDADKVNRFIPAGWSGREAVQRVQAEFRKRPSEPSDRPPNPLDRPPDKSGSNMNGAQTTGRTDDVTLGGDTCGRGDTSSVTGSEPRF
jgi:hypothetical protein